MLISHSKNYNTKNETFKKKNFVQFYFSTFSKKKFKEFVYVDIIKLSIRHFKKFFLSTNFSCFFDNLKI